MKAIVAGANGFVGSSLVKRLIADGFEVLAIDVSLDPFRFFGSRLVKLVQSDLSDLNAITSTVSFGEYDLFYNLAWRGVNGPEKADYNVQTGNILLSLRCADLAKQLGCRKYLCAGTIAERAIESLDLVKTANASMMYGSAKRCCRVMLETYCKCIGIDFVWMQFSNIFGPGNKTGNLISYTINQLIKGEPATFGPALQPYDFIFVDDLIEAVLRLGTHDTQDHFYFLGSGTPLILSDYLRKVGKYFGRDDLIMIGSRPDDGVRYSFDMFDNSSLIRDIGEYVSGSFDDLLKATIQSELR